MLKMTLNSSGLWDGEGKQAREKNGQKSLRRQRPFKGCERRVVVPLPDRAVFHLRRPKKKHHSGEMKIMSVLIR
jgi:hypothetical protein